MKLLTQEIVKKLPKLGDTEGVPTKDKAVIVKFFDPTGSWTWYATEWDGEDLFFGLVDGWELEWGYFSLKELKSVRGLLGLGIERDMYFGMPKIKDVPALKDRV
jgi:hypothetical protein